MNEFKKTEYNREYNKEKYKTVKVYIREEEYPNIINQMEKRGYTKLSGYIKDLIQKDAIKNEAGEQKTVNIGRDNNGQINM